MTSTRDREINIDQNSAAAEEWGVNMDSFAPLGQSFTAVSDHVRFIGMWFSTSPNIPPVRFQLTLLEGAGFSGATVDARYATAPAGLYGFLYFDFSGTKLTVGSKYTALIVQDPPVNPTDSSELLGLEGPPNVYPGGTAFISGVAAADPPSDCYFRVLHTIYTAQVQPPLNADGSSIVTRGEHITVKFTLEADGVPTCDLPRARLVLYGGFKDHTVLLKAAYRRGECEYVYDLHTKALAAAGYKIAIFIHDIEVGNVFFSIQ
jgi:hypothetical protein